MTEFGKLYNLDLYRKRGRVLTRQEVFMFLRNISGPHYTLIYNPDGEVYKPKPPKVYDVWVTASLTLLELPSSGLKLLDWFNATYEYVSRYQLQISVVTGTSLGKRIDSCNGYHLYTPSEVKRQIDWERTRACGNGEFYFQNYTGELNELFIELEWVAAK